MNCGGGQSVHNSGELHAIDFVLRPAPSRPFVLFDVGANDGEYLEAVLPGLGSDARAFSFEPQSSSFAKLQARFGADARVTLRQAAVGREPGNAQLFLAGEGSISSLHPDPNTSSALSERVEITTVDSLLAELSLPFISFLKIDTEGHEIDVLAGAAQSLNDGRIFAVQVEFGDPFLYTPYHFRDLYELLAPKYRLYRILRSGPYEIPGYSHDLEIFKLSNYLAVLRTT